MTDFEVKPKQKETEGKTNATRLLELAGFLFLLILYSTLRLLSFLAFKIGMLFKKGADKLALELQKRMRANDSVTEHSEDSEDDDDLFFSEKRKDWLLKNKDYITIAGYKKAFGLNDYEAQKDIRLLREAGMLRKDPSQGNAHRLVLEAVAFD
jgi:hypothetical protein